MRQQKGEKQVLCYFCGKPVLPGQERNEHRPKKRKLPKWTVPSHGPCHRDYHSSRGEFREWAKLSPYSGIRGYRLAVARWPGFHRMGGLMRAQTAQRDERGRFVKKGA